MKSILKQGNHFYYPSFVLVVLASFSLLFLNTGDLLLYFNDGRSEFWKDVIAVITQFGEEPMYALFFIVFLFLSLRYALMIPVIGIIVTIVSFGLKSLFKHPRPKIFFQDLIKSGELDMIEGIHTIGGYTSFPSGHTVSAFCLFGFVAYVASKYVKSNVWQWLFLTLAVLVAFSRIYLFQHFLKDVTLGALIGTLLAIFHAWLVERFLNQPEKWYQGTILELLQKPNTTKA